MMLLDRATGGFRDDYFRNLPGILRSGDLLILNDSRVIPARLHATRARGLHTQANSPDPTGRIEVLLTQRLSAHDWSALVRPSRKIQPGERLLFHAPDEAVPLLEAEVIDAAEFGERTLRFKPVEDFYAILDRIGHMPLPPYIHREDRPEDRDRYQTVYARKTGSHQPGSAAAPTAGLHFTPPILEQLTSRGVTIADVLLHVGAGTFKPVEVDDPAEHVMHEEWYSIGAQTAATLNAARDRGAALWAVGTTTVRTLESAVRADGRFEETAAETRIFIRPPYGFRAVDRLLTNFHLPHSTLIMLVAAFAGYDLTMRAYRAAVEERYRFFSYGDAMLII